MDITEADFMRSKLFFEQLIDKELELGLFHKRNMDAIMICCLYCVLKFRDVNVGMEELSAHYAKQPQYVVAVKLKENV